MNIPERTGKSLSSVSDSPRFEPYELQAMHRYCLEYRDLVRGGGTPTPEQDEMFMAFQRVCYAEGVALGR